MKVRKGDLVQIVAGKDRGKRGRVLEARPAERRVIVENLNVAVMGCIVNGPGESKHADIGISLPGTGEAPAAPVFVDGEKVATLRGERIADEFHQMVEQYIEKRFGAKAMAPSSA